MCTELNFSWENKNACRSSRDSFVFGLRDVQYVSTLPVIFTVAHSCHGKTYFSTAIGKVSFAAAAAGHRTNVIKFA